jgi:hypothetical protein
MACISISSCTVDKSLVKSTGVFDSSNLYNVGKGRLLTNSCEVESD